MIEFKFNLNESKWLQINFDLNKQTLSIIEYKSKFSHENYQILNQKGRIIGTKYMLHYASILFFTPFWFESDV